jgi:hypothetical protein
MRLGARAANRFDPRTLAVFAFASFLVAVGFLVAPTPAQAQTPPTCPPGSQQVLPPGKTECRPVCEVDAQHPVHSLTASMVTLGTASGTFAATALSPSWPAEYSTRGLRDCATQTSPTTWDVKHFCPMPHCVHWHTYVPNGGNPVPATAIATVNPDGGSFLLGWSAPCAPPRNLADPRMGCSVTLTADRSVEATLSNVADSTPPTAPRVSKVSAKRFQTTIRWTPSTDTWLAGYEIFRNGVLYARRGPAARELTATSLLCNTVYKWRVDAFDAASSRRSNFIRVRTGACAKVPPNTVMHVVPPSSTRQRSAYFHWGAVRFGRDLSSFKSQCKLDGATVWQKCRPGKTYTGLKPGQHTFRVRAGLDGQGWDRTPAKYVWRVRA